MPSVHTLTLGIPDPASELMAGPALRGLSCFFINILGPDVTRLTAENLAPSCAPNLEVGSVSRVVSLGELLGGVKLEGIPAGSSRTVQVLGVTHPSGNCPSGPTAYDSLFRDNRPVPDVYVLGSTSLATLKSGENEVEVSSTYNSDTATSLTAGCRNIWRATSEVGAPSGRTYHTAVYAGAKMIVWGGVGDSSSYLDTGGIYDPSTDTWTTTSTTSAPEGRYYHTAVYTGAKMIVWGGIAGDFFNTGGIYDPSTDTWTPTSATTAPEGRWEHTAVYTGAKMIVWGGYNGGYLNSGGIYDPSTDTWTATSTTTAPEARYDPTAVYTGAKMIVWGGNSESEVLNTGGSFWP